MALKRGDREYNADKNEWEVKKPKKTAAKPKAKPAQKKKPPVPVKRSVKDKVRVPKGPQKERKGVPTNSVLAVNSDGAGVTRKTKAGNTSRNWKGNESAILKNKKSR